MIDRIAVIVPTRGRPQAAQQLIEEFYDNGLGYADLVFGVDHDDPELYRYEEVFHNDFPGDYVAGPRLRMNGTLNYVAGHAVKAGYKYIGFMGDDHRPRTGHWDYRFVDAMSQGTSIHYGNDLIQGVNLPTAVFMTSDIVAELGYMAPPELTHLYLDNFWKDLGNRVGILNYHDDIIIEHLHPSVGKAEWDDQYKEVNNEDMYSADSTAYNKYQLDRFESDIEKIRGLL